MRSRRASWVAAVVAVVGLVGLSGCGQGSTDGVSLRDLSTGDCLKTASTSQGMIIQSRVGCAEPHDAEVAATFSAGPSTDPYPGPADLRSQGDDRCAPEVVAYVGATRTDSVSAMIFFPTDTMWRHHVTKVACVVRPAKIKTTTVSLLHP